MHENLKMRIDLTNTTDWQAIAGRQHLGTFYMLYLKFRKYQEVPNPPALPEHHYTFNFKIQNFAGPITFGLSPKPPGTRDQKSYESKLKKRLKAEISADIHDHFKGELKGRALLDMVEQKTEKKLAKALEKSMLQQEWDYQLRFNIYPFFRNEEVNKITLKFAKKLSKDMVLDIDINDSMRLGSLYNPENPDQSLYADPTHWKRDGDDWLKVTHKEVNDQFEPILGEGRPGGICYPRRALITS